MIGKRLTTLVLLAILLAVTGFTGVAAAQTGGGAGELQPLIDFLDSLAQLLMLAGASLGTLGFATAGVMYMIPGEDWSRKAKTVAKSTIIGLVILLSANMMVAWIASQLGGF
ncbi:hypothetical protein G3I44_14475 [Halogeometricum borinquense]|uniref:TrbC/VIRB2 family protein n=1 Tax=Halogeometricum borinquense TaxID=60847 RepID=A0A6C0UIS1_9EURY|nr:hypothetical protein [Halogeometricum borinquense]QIB75392.1 hypothetical protein G3I44_14475 [Halogeometricum borinquense]